MAAELIKDLGIALLAILAVPLLLLAACGFRLVKGKWPC
jgi:outer membrane lipopolysaccharide assembly protein LptE/RlpB